MYCCPLWFNSTSSTVKKLKCSYNSVLRRLLCIRMPYSASAMFVTHGIPSFDELLSKCIYNYSERISSSSNSIIKACLSPIIFIFSPIRHHHEGFATLYLAVKQRYWCRVTRRSGAHSAPRKIANSVTTCPDDAIRARRQPSRLYDPHR